MRIASFNVNNLFQRAKALNLGDWEEGKPIVAAQAEANRLLQEDVYTDEIKDEILHQLEILGLLRSDESEFAVLRKSSGRLLRRPQDRSEPVEVVADGRAGWVGSIELKYAPVDALSRKHTAMVIRDVRADVLGVVEAESRPTLSDFNDTILRDVGGVPYERVMLVDGRDPRGIDVGILARGTYELGPIQTHVYDTDSDGPIFSRDSCEYHLTTAGGTELVVLMNHFKSKGYGTKGDPDGSLKRRRQADRVADIYEHLRARGTENIAVLGDLNAEMKAPELKPLLEGTDLRDISTIAGFAWGPRTGTFDGRNDDGKFDYVLLSPALYERVVGGGVWRMGIWRGPRTPDPWPIYDTMESEAQAASDHAAIFADIDI